MTGQADGTGAIPLHLPEQNVISGTIHDRVGDAFSYRILDAQGEEVVRGAIAAADGAFDSSAESIHITVDPETPPGRYAICLFDVSAAEQPASITSSTSCYPVEIVQATDSEPTAE